MDRTRRSDGKHWDTKEIRREREFGWFRQHEGDLIEEARLKRQQATTQQLDEEAESRRRLHWRKCPDCGNDLHIESVEGVDVEKCASCQGTFLAGGELETLLIRHDAHRRGSRLGLLGLHQH